MTDADRIALSNEIFAEAHAMAAAAQPRRRLADGAYCAYCDEWGDDPSMPHHDASEKCESGKHSHCTCDTCF